MSPRRRSEVCVLAPTGTLGYGFSKEDLRAALERHRPDVIAVDAGSTDPGPYYLGAGESFTRRLEIKAELETLIGAALERGIPLVVGSAGGCGGRPHVEWTRAIVEELARERAWRFMLGVIHAELEPAEVQRRLEAGEVLEFESGEPLTEEAVEASVRIVAQMGVEPIAEALRRGAQVVLAGRACDDAVIAAYPILRGFDRGLALHMGKILECGALAAEPIGMDVMVGVLRDDHFELVPGGAQRACTVTSVAAHSFYERESPLVQRGPGGTVDLTTMRVEQVDGRTVRVSGTTYRPDPHYTVKLEGVRRSGFRTISIAGIRCPSMIACVDDALAEARRRTERYFADIGVPEGAYRVAYHVYGRDGVMGALEPRRAEPAHELGLVMEVVASEPELAKTVCHHLSGSLLHLDFPGQYNNSGNLAFLYSPSEVDVGEVYEFSVYHLLRLADPLEPFPIELAEVG